jgi:hypothetical protein
MGNRVAPCQVLRLMVNGDDSAVEFARKFDN